jgi:hypothetical protein
MTHPTKVRTYDRETWNRADAEWRAGRFGPEWPDWRNLAGKAGIIFPPAGSPDDSWTDASPSQRAIVIRAIRETPRLLRWALARPGISSWGDVIEHLLSGRDRLGMDADRRADEWATVKRTDRPTRIGDVLAVVSDSLS